MVKVSIVTMLLNQLSVSELTKNKIIIPLQTNIYSFLLLNIIITTYDLEGNTQYLSIASRIWFNLAQIRNTYIKYKRISHKTKKSGHCRVVKCDCAQCNQKSLNLLISAQFIRFVI